MRLLLYVALLLGVITQPQYGQAQQPSAVPVATIAAEVRPITRATDFVGRVEAMDHVDIRARVTGVLQQVLFKEGDLVKEGDVLFRIEPDTFDAAVLQARGALLGAQGQYANATAQRARTEELAKTDTASRSTLDQRIAAEKIAQGDVVTANANLRTAEINLGYTQIVAPISGEIGRSKFTKGNVVGPNSDALTEIVSRDPMYVTFPVSQRDFLKVKNEEERRERGQTFTIRIRFSDGSTYDQVGRINFIDVKVDRATDTVSLRATMPNPNGTLIDGQLVRVLVETGKPEERVLVPQSALIVDQQGTYVFAVEDGKAAVKRVKLGGESGPFAIIDNGLKGGEQVVVQGMESLRPGATVNASPAQRPAERS
ncbi:MAG: efflux RND transporter periplasmic adaptor subunit [Alphaproteobacteria bacterium]|nr:efflux RND transporter periplasmic adaptor subunit [Alphaproteobacteria bacterium]